jgi:N-ethylmaleimide reductase
LHEHYGQRTGAGLIISEATSVSIQGLGWVDSPGIYTAEQSQAWRQVVDAVHAGGSRIFLQMWHCGRASHSSFQGGQSPVAPSAIKLEGDGLRTPNGKQPYETPRALGTDELPGIVADYVTAARHAKNAGFDGVEVHAANGYLLDQFLQSKTNKRDDAYGGDVRGRFRFVREVIEGVLTVFPAERVGVRLGPNGVFNDMGSPDFRETFLYVARELNAYGLAYLHLLDGLAFGFHELGEPMTLGEFRGVFDGALIGNCGYTRESANAAIQGGAADLIAFGRAYMTNPDLAERFREGAPLAPDSDPESWFAAEAGPRGYTDWPTYSGTVGSEDLGARAERST